MAMASGDNLLLDACGEEAMRLVEALDHPDRLTRTTAAALPLLPVLSKDTASKLGHLLVARTSELADAGTETDPSSLRSFIQLSTAVKPHLQPDEAEALGQWLADRVVTPPNFTPIRACQEAVALDVALERAESAERRRILAQLARSPSPSMALRSEASIFQYLSLAAALRHAPVEEASRVARAHVLAGLPALLEADVDDDRPAWICEALRRMADRLIKDDLLACLDALEIQAQGAKASTPRSWTTHAIAFLGAHISSTGDPGRIRRACEWVAPLMLVNEPRRTLLFGLTAEYMEPLLRPGPSDPGEELRTQAWGWIQFYAGTRHYLKEVHLDTAEGEAGRMVYDVAQRRPDLLKRLAIIPPRVMARTVKPGRPD
jgi:hypothetical protein